MKILFTVASYYPDIGGVQMVTQNTAEEMVRQGHDVTVLISGNPQKQPSHNLRGVKLEYYNLHTEKDRIVGNKKRYVVYMKEKCKSYDVLINVSVHSALTDALLPVLKDLSCVKMLYLHGIYEFRWTEKDKSSFQRIASKLYYNIRRRRFYASLYRYAKNYDLISHLSEEDISLKYMVEHGINQNIVIHNAAEEAFFQPPVSQCKERFFLHVANYAEHKNQEFSLRAFYKASCADTKMVYIGAEENAYYCYLKKLNEMLSEEYGGKRVSFLTGVSRKDTIEMFKHATAIILSSRVEKFPMVLVEGMACGVPFISTDCGSVKSLPGGYVVHDISEMGELMTKVVDKHQEILCLCSAGREYAIQNFSLEKNVKQLVHNLKKRVGNVYE